MKIQKRQSQFTSHEVWRLWVIQNVNSAGFAGLSFWSGCDSRVLGVLGLTLCLAGCVGTTGGELLTFDAYGAGPEDAVQGQPYSFTNSRGYTITLDRAVVYIGAVYLNRSRPTSVGSDTGCFLSGIYGAEVTSGRFVDILSPEWQAFPEAGFGTTDRAFTGEVWLFGGNDVNDIHDSTRILDVAGTAEKDGLSYPFEGQITISENRVEEPASPAQPGSDPICKQRVVTPIPVDIQLSDGGSLVIRVDPRGMFANVQFSALTLVQESPPLYQFADNDDDAPGRNLYSGLRAAEGTYFFETAQ
ncbi:MAG: hypothetical protein IPK82_22650 [Polyangiaceae bacterium]|nr:hypothetical protein [Polyangiaceae bacterium]